MSALRNTKQELGQLEMTRSQRSRDGLSQLPLKKASTTCIPKSALRQDHYERPTLSSRMSTGPIGSDGTVDGTAMSIEARCAVNYPLSSRSSTSSVRTPAKLQRRRSRPNVPKKTGFWAGYHYERVKRQKDSEQTDLSGMSPYPEEQQLMEDQKQTSSSSSLVAEPFPPFEPKAPEAGTRDGRGTTERRGSNSEPNTSRANNGNSITEQSIQGKEPHPRPRSSNIHVRQSLLQPVTEEPVGYDSDTTGRRISITTSRIAEIAGYDSDSGILRSHSPSPPEEATGYDSDSTIRPTAYHRRDSAHQSSPPRGFTNRHIEFAQDLPPAEHTCQVPGHSKKQELGQKQQWTQAPCQIIPVSDLSDLNGSLTATTLSTSSLHTAPPPHPDCLCRDIADNIHKEDRATDVHRDLCGYCHRDRRICKHRVHETSTRPRASTDACFTTTPLYQSWVESISIPPMQPRGGARSTVGNKSSSPGPRAESESRTQAQGGSFDSTVGSLSPPPPIPIQTPAANLPGQTSLAQNEGVADTDIRDDFMQPSSTGSGSGSIIERPSANPIQSPSQKQTRSRKEHSVELVLQPPAPAPYANTVAPFIPIALGRPPRVRSPVQNHSQGPKPPPGSALDAGPNADLTVTDSSPPSPAPPPPSNSTTRPKPCLRPGPLRVSPRRSGATTRPSFPSSQPSSSTSTQTREIATQTSFKTLRTSESFVHRELNAELAALPAATYPWLSLSLVRQVRETFRVEFATFQKQVDERLAAIEDMVERQQEWLEEMMEGGMCECQTESESESQETTEGRMEEGGMPGGWREEKGRQR